jgi:hypothetical protein
MKAIFIILVLSVQVTACAQVSDPLSDFRNTFSSLGASAVLLKWEADINGDGFNEVFITDKDSYDKASASNEPADWLIYIATSAGFIRCDEVYEGDQISIGVLLSIDLGAVFVGSVSEVEGDRALVTEQIRNPRAGEPAAVVNAYVIEGEHLRATKIGEYNPTQKNVLFDKYFKDGKRTIIVPVEENQ